MGNELRRNEEGHFLGDEDDRGRLSKIYKILQHSKSDLYLNIKKPAIHISTVTAGWLENEKTLSELHAGESGLSRRVYFIHGEATLRSNEWPHQKLGLISTDGAFEFGGEVHVEIKNGLDSKSQVNYLKESHDHVIKHGEQILFSLFIDEKQIEWLIDKITSGKYGDIDIIIIWKPFINIENILNAGGTFYIEPENFYFTPEKGVQILGASIRLGSHPVSPVPSEVNLVAASSPARADVSRLGERAANYLQWIIFLLAGLIVAVLLKGCKV